MSSSLLKTSLLFAGAGLLLSGLAAAAPVSPVQSNTVLKPKIPPLIISLSCRAEYPPEFTNSLAIINKGPGTVATGKIVHWVFKAGIDEGDYTFTAPLTPNHKVYLAHVLHGEVAANAPCAGPVTFK